VPIGHGKRHIAAHRQTADHGLIDVQVIEQRYDVIGENVDREQRTAAFAFPKTAQVGGDVAPTGWNCLELRRPHCAAEWKTMNEYDRITGAALTPVQTDAIKSVLHLVPRIVWWGSRA
jgi:hypothetical protein